MPPFTLSPALPEDKLVFENLMHLYLYDFSEYTEDDVNEQGRFVDEHLERYWIEPNRYPFLFIVGNHYAGFVLVRDFPDPETGEMVHSIAEFFVMKKYRRQKFGKQMAWQIFDRFPGRWHVAQEEKNVPAQQFWRNTISEYTAGRYDEKQDPQWHGPIQVFRTTET
jgi:predicted acetyltransferase